MLRPPPTSTLFPYTTLFRSVSNQLGHTGTTYPQARMSVLYDLLNRIGLDGRLESSRLGEVELAIESDRSEEHTSELQSRGHLVCRLLLEKKNKIKLYYNAKK